MCQGVSESGSPTPAGNRILHFADDIEKFPDSDGLIVTIVSKRISHGVIISL